MRWEPGHKEWLARPREWAREEMNRVSRSYIFSISLTSSCHIASTLNVFRKLLMISFYWVMIFSDSPSIALLDWDPALNLIFGVYSTILISSEKYHILSSYHQTNFYGLGTSVSPSTLHICLSHQNLSSNWEFSCSLNHSFANENLDSYSLSGIKHAPENFFQRNLRTICSRPISYSTCRRVLSVSTDSSDSTSSQLIIDLSDYLYYYDTLICRDLNLIVYFFIFQRYESAVERFGEDIVDFREIIKIIIKCSKTDAYFEDDDWEIALFELDANSHLINRIIDSFSKDERLCRTAKKWIFVHDQLTVGVLRILELEYKSAWTEITAKSGEKLEFRQLCGLFGILHRTIFFFLFST
jgi:hypothetical protein